MTKTKIAMVADSTCDLPKDIVEKYGLNIVCLKVVSKDRDYRDTIDINPEKLYELIDEETPTTSLPEPRDYKKVFDELEKEGYTDIIVTTISSGLSGTFHLVKMLAKEYEKIKIHVFDSKALTTMSGFLIIEGCEEILRSNDAEKVLKRMQDTRDRIEGIFIVKTLYYLRKGGRIGKVEGTVGNLLDIKPIIRVNEDGIYCTLKKVRTYKRAINKMFEHVEKNYKNKSINVAVVHGMAAEEAEKLMIKIKGICNVKNSFITQVSAVLGVHTGRGLLSIIVYEAF